MLDSKCVNSVDFPAPKNPHKNVTGTDIGPDTRTRGVWIVQTFLLSTHSSRVIMAEDRLTSLKSDTKTCVYVCAP